MDNICPEIDPKNSLKSEPVNPINAEISNWSNAMMRARSIGLKKDRITIGFSIG